jgi:hypothetical protein
MRGCDVIDSSEVVICDGAPKSSDIRFWFVTEVGMEYIENAKYCTCTQKEADGRGYCEPYFQDPNPGSGSCSGSSLQPYFLSIFLCVVLVNFILGLK